MEKDKYEGEGLFEYNQALSEGGSLSYGDNSQFARPPNLQRLVHLGQEHWRIPFCHINNTGVKVSGICGQKVKDCKRHASRGWLGASNYQYGIGYNPLLVPVSCGFTRHNVACACGPYYTDAQVQAFQAEEAQEMTHHVHTMNEDVSDEEEVEELSRDVCVKFASRTPN